MLSITVFDLIIPFGTFKIQQKKYFKHPRVFKILFIQFQFQPNYEYEFIFFKIPYLNISFCVYCMLSKYVLL